MSSMNPVRRRGGRVATAAATALGCLVLAGCGTSDDNGSDASGSSRATNASVAQVCDDGNAYFWFVKFLSSAPLDAHFEPAMKRLLVRIDTLATEVPAAQREGAQDSATLWRKLDRAFTRYDYDESRLPKNLESIALKGSERYRKASTRFSNWLIDTCSARYDDFPQQPTDAPTT